MPDTSTPDRAAKIETIRESIANGSYFIDTEALAEKMLQAANLTRAIGNGQALTLSSAEHKLQHRPGDSLS